MTLKLKKKKLPLKCFKNLFFRVSVLALRLQVESLAAVIIHPEVVDFFKNKF